MNTSTDEVKITITNPKTVGYWRILGNEHRPSWWHRLWTRILLGWKWIDA